MDAATAYRKAGMPLSHGEAIQQVANEQDRIIVSRCAQEIGVQLLEENYSSKGFGIKAKSCDWGPFAGFAMGHFQFSKFETGEERYRKQIKFFKDSGHTGFHNKNVHQEMAKADTLRLTTARLQFLAGMHKIQLPGGIADGMPLTAEGPFGPVVFWLQKMPGSSDACWGLQYVLKLPQELQALATRNQGTTGVDSVADWGKRILVNGMTNTLPEDRNLADPAKCCVAGDYDLWGVFPKKGSSMEKHGMERQARLFAGVNPNASGGIKDRVAALRNDTLSRAPERTFVKNVGGNLETFKYQEDPEFGNVSPLLFHTMHAVNKAIQARGYRGGRMVHHNDDMGNPFREDVEKQVIAFIPKDRAYFVDNAEYYSFIRPYKEEYAVYDNPAIWGKR
jgi:hypothetical protein